MALAPFNVIGGGKLRTDAEEEKRAASGENGRTMMGGDWRRNENEKKMSHALEKVANEIGAKSITSGIHGYFRPFTSLVKFESCSGDRLCDAKGSLRISPCRGSQSGASSRQHRSTEDLPL